MNSILSHIENNLNDKTATVRQLLNHDSTKNKTILIVEGKDDEDFYGTFLDDKKIYLYPISGCSQFMDILHNLNPKYKHRLGAIKDADFDHLNRISYDVDNLLLTDAHDYEMMMITPERVKDIAIEYGVKNDVAKSIFDTIVKNIVNYSFIKWHNSRRPSGQKGINFGKSKAIHHFGKSVSESVTLLKCNLANHNISFDIADIELLVASNPSPDFYQLINGHDFCLLIAKVIKDLRSVNIKKKDIPNKLIQRYPREAFIETRLATSLGCLFPECINP